jgi:hypothetical protein
MDGANKPSAVLAIVLALAAAACLSAAAFTNSWLVNGNAYEQIHFGLREMTQSGSSFGEADTTRSNAEVVADMREVNAAAARDTSSAFAPMGWATFVECLIAALGLVAAAIIAATRKHPELPITPTTISLLGIMLGLITGCVFVATKPGPPGYVGVGLSFWLFGGGCVLGIAGAQMLAKVNRPPDPDLMEDAMDPDQF